MSPECRALSLGDDPGLSRGVQPSHVGFLRVENLSRLWSERDVTTGKWSDRYNIAGLEDGEGGHS